MSKRIKKSYKIFLAEKKREFTKEQAKKIGDKIGVDWDKVDLEQFRMGLGVETEHDAGDENDVVKNLETLAKIALAHLKELPNYYTKLKKIEEDAPANSVAADGVAGLTVATGGPIVRKQRKPLKKFKRKMLVDKTEK